MHHSSTSVSGITIEYAGEGIAKYFDDSEVEGFFRDTFIMIRPHFLPQPG